MLAEIDRVEALLSGQTRDGDEKLHQSVDRLRGFVKGRRGLLEKELKDWPRRLTTGPRTPGFAKVIGKGHAAFSTQWTESKPSAPETRGEVEIEVSLHGEPIRFKQIGATARPNDDRSARLENGKMPPSLILHGVRQSDGKSFTFAMTTTIGAFKGSEEPVSMGGIMIEGSMIAFVTQMMLNPASITLIDAKATFAEASMEVGAPVEGVIDFQVMKFDGGKSPDMPWVDEE